MTFSRKIELKKEYEQWIEKNSKELGAQLDVSSFITVLIFLEDRGLLIDPNRKLMDELYEAAITEIKAHKIPGTMMDDI